MQWIPADGKTLGIRNVIWHYGLWPVDSGSKDIDFNILDCKPENFPYY
jgi:hypothetical protein